MISKVLLKNLKGCIVGSRESVIYAVQKLFPGIDVSIKGNLLLIADNIFKLDWEFRQGFKLPDEYYESGVNCSSPSNVYFLKNIENESKF